jgi:flavin reductase (DIM6/NTAB) family NADH-FMN oxidoreductase RutF
MYTPAQKAANRNSLQESEEVIQQAAHGATSHTATAVCKVVSTQADRPWNAIMAAAWFKQHTDRPPLLVDTPARKAANRRSLQQSEQWLSRA